jgi:hypothetical protein
LEGDPAAAVGDESRLDVTFGKKFIDSFLASVKYPETNPPLKQ